jgi:hypothetical protein
MLGTAIEITCCSDKRWRRVMEKNDDVGTLVGMVDNDDRSVHSSRAESFE